MTTAEWDNARYTKAYAELFEELVVQARRDTSLPAEPGAQPLVAAFIARTADRGVSGIIVDFIERTGSR
jgi:hypothetical protein